MASHKSPKIVLRKIFWFHLYSQKSVFIDLIKFKVSRILIFMDNSILMKFKKTESRKKIDETIVNCGLKFLNC